jgi:cold-inducible RNA-binding protein
VVILQLSACLKHKTWQDFAEKKSLISKRGKTMKNLYVGNLPHSTTEPQLRTLFEAHGAVERVNIVMDKETGRSKGFAFVEMTDTGEANKACLALSGSDLGGRSLRVNEAKAK